MVLGDLTHEASLAPACERIDIVYHIAATYRTAGQPDGNYRAVNAHGTHALLNAAQQAGVTRFVHCSTVGVHGHIERPPADEDAPLAPGDIYQKTKLEGEELARSAARGGSMEVVVARPAGIYGPGDIRFLKMFRGIAKRRFPMLGKGTVCYHLTYIDDLVEGFRLCGESPIAAGRTYVLAGPRYTSLNELVRVIAEELGVAPPRWRFPVWPVWLAGALCVRSVRAAGYRTAALPATGRILHQEPGVRCHARKAGAAIRPGRRSRRRRTTHRRMVPGARLALALAPDRHLYTPWTPRYDPADGSSLCGALSRSGGKGLAAGRGRLLSGEVHSHSPDGPHLQLHFRLRRGVRDVRQLEARAPEAGHDDRRDRARLRLAVLATYRERPHLGRRAHDP